MNYVDPFRNDASVVYNEVTYTMGYYAQPKTLSGVTNESYPDYDASVTYQVGESAIIPELHGIYKSSLADNTGNYPPASPNAWTFMGPVNTYRMLAVDEFIGSQTVGADCIMEFDFSGATAFSMVDCGFKEVTIEQIKNANGEVLKSIRTTGSSYDAASYYEYFYLPLTKITRVYKDGFVWDNDCTLRLSFTGGVEIGAIIIGAVEEAGCTMYGTSLRIEDSSTITTSPVTGFRTVTRYGRVRVLDAKVRFGTDDFNALSVKADRLVSKNILFVPTKQDKFSEMITIGYIEDFNIPVNNPSKISTQITIIGVI